MLRIHCIFLFVLLSLSVSSQCFPDRHNSTIYNGWISCEVSPNPNSLRGAGHWISYEFDKEYSINGISIWNTNHPDFLTSGISRFFIDVSFDGITWSEAGAYDLPISSGLSTYQGTGLESWIPADARFVLLTAESNYGGDCTGFSEIKFDVQERTTSTDELVTSEHLKFYPNPVRAQGTLELSDMASGNYRIQVVDALGRIALTDDVVVQSSMSRHIVSAEGLSDGYYVLKVVRSDVLQSIPITVIAGR